ncbi:K+/H+ antiporter subunit F [Ochrobactrum oryzae]|uniref:K+/H+ antiporter subunit F n=1 Tax=Brucella oryzae TaxID=335286 RepID=A0A2S7J3Q7_9HYPH|nr:K+/H+ antiporter subunit F [Brucella oryzae]MBR7654770.1 K+/H+ antiporter subunit F [Brucella oryzae]NKC22912.1 K+/H+ antiporter subunit F [Brucella oryzae]PQA74881.1 K+/H+ antiporter subunit F [Brucella oryzae]
MSAVIIFWSLLAAQLMLLGAMGCAVYRLLVGPRAQDRILATDALYLNALLLLITFGIRTGSLIYFEAALIIALLGFVATVALSKFLMRGEVIE